MPLSAGREQILTPWPDEVSVTGDWRHVVTRRDKQNRKSSCYITPVVLTSSSPPDQFSHITPPSLLPRPVCFDQTYLMINISRHTQIRHLYGQDGFVVMLVPSLVISLLQNIHLGSPVDEALSHEKRTAIPWQWDGDGIPKLPNKCLLCSPLKCL